jgi:hypothetical protein
VQLSFELREPPRKPGRVVNASAEYSIEVSARPIARGVLPLQVQQAAVDLHDDRVVAVQQFGQERNVVGEGDAWHG